MTGVRKSPTPLYMHGPRPSESFFICLVLINVFLHLIAASESAVAATYYVDAINGRDSNPGTLAAPWKTISKSQSVAVGGDTVILHNGNYGDFIERNVNRTNWLIYKAAAGHHPQLTSISVSAYPTIVNSYLKFTGITVKRADDAIPIPAYVKLQNCRHLEFDSVILQGNGYHFGTIERGFALWTVKDVTIKNSTITGIGTEYQGGVIRGIDSLNADDVRIENCTINQCFIAIEANGNNWLIEDCHIFNIDNDAIQLNNVDNVTINRNIIHDIRSVIIYSDDTGASYDKQNYTITAKEGSQPYPTDPELLTGNENFVRLTDQHGNYITTEYGGYQYQWFWIERITSHTITIRHLNNQPAPDLNYPNISRVEIRRGEHNDFIQFKNNGPCNNVTISNNICYNSFRNGFFLNPKPSTNLTIENNLIYNTRLRAIGIGGVIQLGPIQNIILRNNTLDGMVSTNNRNAAFSSITGNIIKKLTVNTDSGIVIQQEDYNIFGTMGTHIMGNYRRGSHTTLLGTANDYQLYKALFANYNSNDFTLAPNSLAIDFGHPDYAPERDILGNPRDSRPDAGCYEYLPPETANHPPVLQQIGNKSVNENSLLAFMITATDPDGDAITYSAQPLPRGATFSSQTLRWTPTYEQAGNYQVTFTASDGQAQDAETITITVNNVNRAPVLDAIGNKSISEGSILSFSVTATDADGDTITYSAINLPRGAVFANQTFTWTPGYDQSGTYQVSFIASDGQAQDSQTISITVNNVNRAPILSPIGNKSVGVDSLLTFSVNAADPDGDTIQYSVDSLPTGARFVSQRFSWVPTQSQAGNYEVTFMASDGQAQDSETVAITVSGTDKTPPTVTNCSPAPDSIQAPLNSLIILHVTDTGKGVDANSVTIKVDGHIAYAGNTDFYEGQFGNCRKSGTKANYRFVYQSNKMFDFDQTITVKINASDLAGNAMGEYSYCFRTEMRSFGKNRKVSSNPGGLGKCGPVTGRDSNGNIWVAWHAGPSGSRNIYISKLTVGAKNFENCIQLTSNAADQCNPDIALAGNGHLFIVWQDNRRGNWDIYMSSSADGMNWSSPELITDSNDNQINPAIVMDRVTPNRGYITWQDDRGGNQDIYIVTSDNGFLTKVVSRITSDSADQLEPAMAVDSVSNIYVVWTDRRNGTDDIYGASSNNGPWRNVAIVRKANNQSHPVIATEANGSILHLLWVDDISGNSDIYYVATDGLPGGPLTGTNIIDDSSGADQLEPAIAVTGSTGNNLRVFACWQDWRNVNSSGADTDLYFAEISSGSSTNVFVGDDTTNADQSEPVVGIDEYGHPYVIWTDTRNINADIYYAGSTSVEPTALAMKDVPASQGAKVYATATATSSVDEVCIEVPPGAYSSDMKITISRVQNPQLFTIQQLSPVYEFGPSGIEFAKPVTITIPYQAPGPGDAVSAYWYNPLTGTLNQQGITDVQSIIISPTSHALRFKTNHLTQYLVGSSSSGSGGNTASGAGASSGAGGCSICASGDGRFIDFLLPYVGLTIVMAMVKLRDFRQRQTSYSTKSKCGK